MCNSNDIHYDYSDNMDMENKIMTYIGILIDPNQRSVAYVESEFKHEQILKILDVKSNLLDFSAGIFGRWTQTIVEDFSAFNLDLPSFNVRDYRWPIRGRALVIGYDSAGETQSVPATIEQIHAMIEW
jgi:hypothetical protein